MLNVEHVIFGKPTVKSINLFNTKRLGELVKSCRNLTRDFEFESLKIQLC